MRSALLIADGKVVLGPSPASEVEAEFKATVQLGGNGCSVIELWSDDRGCVRKQKFASVSAKSVEKPTKKKA